MTRPADVADAWRVTSGFTSRTCCRGDITVTEVVRRNEQLKGVAGLAGTYVAAMPIVYSKHSASRRRAWELLAGIKAAPTKRSR
eukprot:6175361-Pleurochrysis_carterae.AAC.2